MTWIALSPPVTPVLEEDTKRLRNAACRRDRIRWHAACAMHRICSCTLATHSNHHRGTQCAIPV